MEYNIIKESSPLVHQLINYVVQDLNVIREILQLKKKNVKERKKFLAPNYSNIKTRVNDILRTYILEEKEKYRKFTSIIKRGANYVFDKKQRFPTNAQMLAIKYSLKCLLIEDLSKEDVFDDIKKTFDDAKINIKYNVR